MYFHKFSDELYEYEYDHVWLGEYSGDILCDPAEAMDSLWVNMKELEEDMEKNPEKYSVWFLTACPEVIRILREQTGEKSCEK